MGTKSLLHGQLRRWTARSKNQGVTIPYQLVVLLTVSVLAVFRTFVVFTETTTSKSTTKFLGTSTTTKHILGFVHIPKTGGSSIEIAGATAGLNWGSCMFKPLLQRTQQLSSGNKSGRSSHNDVIANDLNDDQTRALQCPSNELLKRYEGRPVPRNVRNSMTPWHAPIQCLPVPYYQDLFEELFAVVRNPYTRMLSEYYFACQDFGIPQKCSTIDKVRNDPIFMNRWIQHLIRRQALSTDPGPACNMIALGHFIRQYDFIFDKGGKQRVRHLIRMEHLDDDFHNLMVSHKLDHVVVLPKQREKQRNTHLDTLTVHNFTMETVALIKEFYRKDFELGNYSLALP
jgi:hypothetical protein